MFIWASKPCVSLNYLFPLLLSAAVDLSKGYNTPMCWGYCSVLIWVFLSRF